MERCGALGSIIAQARRNLAQARYGMKFWVLSILFKQDNFRSSEQIFVLAKLFEKKQT